MGPGPDDLVFLLGAGASMPAGIPMAAEMIRSLEQGFELAVGQKAAEWVRYKELYWHIRSSIHYARGLEGRFGSEVEFNIETLVNTLGELKRHISHPIYPFIGTWNQRFFELAGNRFSQIEAFERTLLAALQRWILVDRLEKKSKYLAGLVDLRKSLEHPLRIFSLNYDLCIETLEDLDGFHIEQGFGNPDGCSERIWNWRRMLSDLNSRESIETPAIDVYLYKLHGSIDWVRDDDGRLICKSDNLSDLNPEGIQIIFGREAKMDARDPFSFYFSEFRKACKAAKLIVVVGYSFSDPHINQILGGALREEQADKRLVVIDAPFAARPNTKDAAREKRTFEANQQTAIALKFAGAQGNGESEVKWVARQDVIKQRITVVADGADAFFQDTRSWKVLEPWLPSSADPFA